MNFFSFSKLMRRSPFWSLIFWAMVWEFVGQMGWMTLLPPLTDIWFAFAELFEQTAFWDAFAMTARTFGIGDKEVQAYPADDKTFMGILTSTIGSSAQETLNKIRDIATLIYVGVMGSPIGLAVSLERLIPLLYKIKF